MNLMMFALVLLISGLYSVAGGSRYLAIPIEDVGLIELSSGLPSVQRVARRAEIFVPVTVTRAHVEDAEPVATVERSGTDILDYVDFGGHTGENGAFGWYADFPAH